MSDTQLFENFMRNYQNMVFSTAMRLVANAAEAEDIAQEVFLRAFRHFDQLRDNPAAGGWLKTVCTNLSLNHLTRYRARWSFFSELFGNQDDSEGAAPDFPAPDVLEEQLAAQERSQALEEALQRLPAAQRVPLVLHHIEDLSYEEIAAKLGVSLGKVKTDIHRGRQTLRKKLTRQAGAISELI